MAETSHARSRRASLVGLVVQILSFVGCAVLAELTRSHALSQLGWYVLAGVPIWFISVLFFRQQELAALEQLDLEELRREKQATGGGEALFGAEGAGGLGYLVAQNRLEWMRRWLKPVFGLLITAYLIGCGLWRATVLKLPVSAPEWPELTRVELGLIILAGIMLALFLQARYASGMGRAPQWQLLRACGSFMLGNAVAAMALILSLGIYLYQKSGFWEHLVAYAIPWLMVLLGAETLVNFVLDIYRPRVPGTEPRAAFDSRILGLISEPGGIAHTLAEALNYQFGFQVSQTWFYQLLQRAFVPLAGAGLAALWLLTTIVIVGPGEHALVQRFGRLVDPDHPLAPGVRLKLPWPIETARIYETGALHEVVIGRKTEVDPRRAHREPETGVELWTDEEHAGGDHYDFLISPPADAAAPASRPEESGAAPAAGHAEHAVAVNMIRMHVLVKYRIPPEKLAMYVQQASDPQAALRDIAWQEALTLTASATVDALLGPLRDSLGADLKQRISRRVDELGLGVEIVWADLLGIHPEKSVAEAFRGVIGAQQEKVAQIRKARVAESEILSRVAGDASKALALAYTLNNLYQAQTAQDQGERAIRAAAARVPPAALERISTLGPLVQARLMAREARDAAQQQRDRIEEEFELGLGRSTAQRAQVARALADAVTAEQAAIAALEQAIAPVRTELSRTLPPAAVDALLGAGQARLAVAFWSSALEKHLQGLEGDAAVELARAQAARWEVEMQAAAQISRLENERSANAAAPEVYRARRYLQELANGLKHSRKYFLAFDPAGRTIHTRLEAQEQAGPELTDLPTRVGDR